MTWTRKAFLAEGLSKQTADVALAAVELFCDKNHGDKDERYVVGIARKLGRLTDKERETELQRHRVFQEGRGLFSTHFKRKQGRLTR